MISHSKSVFVVYDLGAGFAVIAVAVIRTHARIGFHAYLVTVGHNDAYRFGVSVQCGSH